MFFYRHLMLPMGDTIVQKGIEPVVEEESCKRRDGEVVSRHLRGRSLKIFCVSYPIVMETEKHRCQRAHKEKKVVSAPGRVRLRRRHARWRAVAHDQQ
jgi:hypothetical protein